MTSAHDARCGSATVPGRSATESRGTLFDLEQLRSLETAHRHLPLMERAGQAAAELAMTLLGARGAPVVIFAGPGNNGGDALVVARVLNAQGVSVHVVGDVASSRWVGEAAQAFAAFQAAGLALESSPPQNASLVVDGIFGIGLNRPPSAPWREWIEVSNALARSSRCRILALDCPSGLDAATGRAFTPSVVATHTLTFLADKPGLHTCDGPDHVGEVVVADLGLDLPAWLDEASLSQSEGGHPGTLLTCEEFAPYLKPRRHNTHKGSYGSAGILGGAPSMVGAALLAARAALKLGSGRVYAGLRDPLAPRVDVLQPEIMFRSPAELFRAPLTALAVGPGLGDGDEALALLRQAAAAAIPLVLDADALNLVAASADCEAMLAARTAPTILTPHPAEAARLLGSDVTTVQADRVAAAKSMALRYRALVVLKGSGSVLVSPDGRWWISPAGNPALATAGTGDVLTGLIVALLAQGWPALAAMQAGVLLHGRGAERWCAENNLPSGLTASELIDACRDELGQLILTRPDG